MANLHFNTDSGRQTIALIGSLCSELETQLSQLRTNVDTLVPAEWQGNSARQFQSEFEGLANVLDSIISSLNRLEGQLNAEITNWEDVASQLSG
ncbi:MAG: WXG100 family type VII secretion target [Anaerolineales bacterium]|nr:WXG100 family type VII secretion target [Anaerolineales bacterium]